MTEQATMIGPAALRRLAKWHAGQPALVAELRELAAQWETDRAALERLTAAASGRGMVSEMDGLPEIAVLVTGLHERAERAEAALEQARALAAELAACGYECQAGALENNQAYRELAALLAAASGGAA